MLDLTVKSAERHLLKSRGVTLVGNSTRERRVTLLYFMSGFAKL